MVSQRKRLGRVAAVIALAASSVGIASLAQAGTTPPFSIDGVVADAGAQQFSDPYGNSAELGPLNASTTKLGVIHSAKPPMLASTNPNAQVDFRNIWLDSKADSDGDLWLYFGWERDSNKGSGVIMYEFQQSPAPAECDYTKSSTDLIATCNPWSNRQPGDFVIVWDQNGGSTQIAVRTWQAGTDTNGNGKWDIGEPLVLGPTVTLDANVSKAALSKDGYRGEAAVNLTDTIFAAYPNSCLTIGNVIPGTVTGNSDTADYKDTVLADFTDKLTLSNCGSLTVTKHTDPANGTGEFQYTLSRTDGSTVRFDDGNAATDEKIARGVLTHDGDTATELNLRAGEKYTLTEQILAGAYDLDKITCQGVDMANGTFSIAAGVTAHCDIYNKLQKGTLKIVKKVVNDNGGTLLANDFHYNVDGGAAAAFPDAATTSTVEKQVVPGTYKVTETDANTRGYATTYSDNCAAVVVPAGGSATCTITNDDIAAKLIVKKVVVNDNGGTKTAQDFSFSVNNGAAVAFPAGGSVTQTVNAGTYSVVEPEANTGGYATSYDNCSNVVIPLGGTATCTITNDDSKAAPSAATTQRWILHDSLALTGVRAGAPDAADATATFSLYSDAACTVKVGDSEKVSVSGSTAKTATGVAVSDPGTYYWVVNYSGDAYNEATTSPCGAEVTTIAADDATH